MRHLRFALLAAALLLSFGQAHGLPPGDNQSRPEPNESSAAPRAGSSVSSEYAGYRLGAGDQIAVTVAGSDEFADKHFRVDPSGFLSVPLLGRIRVAGMSVAALEADLDGRLRLYYKDPRTVVAVTEFRSQPVSVLGAVATPGVYPLEGRRTLLEMLARAGGLKDDAGYRVRLTRHKESGPIPLLEAVEDDSGASSVAEISLAALLQGQSPHLNLVIMPQDIISVPRADLVYVIGSVRRAGGFTLKDKENVTVLQALSMAEGATGTAALSGARILRQDPDVSVRREIPLDLGKILAGKQGDLPLFANDILFVPSSKAKVVTYRGLEAAIQAATGVVIWRR